MDKRFLGILAGLVVVFAAIVVVAGGSNDKNASNGTDSSSQPTHHVTGEGKKGVTLMEYGDFQCPVCGSFEPTVAQVRQKYQSEIYFQFRNLPLVSVHPNAFSAARAAEASDKQSKYWQMHDLLYAKQSEWSSSNNPLSLFKGYAQQIGMNVSKFTSDFASSEINSAINADLAEFAKTKQEQATPTFFINGKYVSNQDLLDPQTGPSVEKFSKVIDAEIAKQSQ